MSDAALTPETNILQNANQAQKRKASSAGFPANGRPAKAVKRRASKACQCCRARKVRCNVVEHGAPCTNCRLDEIECVVSESKRKKKWTKSDETRTEADPPFFATRRSLEPQNPLDGLQSLSASDRPISSGATSGEQHVPHSIYQSLANSTSYMQNATRRLSAASDALNGGFAPFHQNHMHFGGPQHFIPSFQAPDMAPVVLPYYLKPIPPRIGHDEISYLRKKGALSIPDTSLRNELLRSYIEYCHPFMPLLDLHDFLRAISSPDGSAGKVSLFTFSAVMFVATAYVPFRHLQNAGYQTRKEARKDFFQKARLLYDFDYEIDRISLVQGLLLLTYYYETPDDSKDTWHYMGLAISLAHTIGLHRNPERSSMDAKRKKLWRRIWWSLYMRDRLIALGMRRPTRIKSEDFDVPALTIDDFELAALPDQVTCISSACVLARDVEKQRQLAIICIEKTKLCLCISQILSTQYSVLNNNQGILSDDGNTRTTMMLLPKKLDSQANEIQMCDEELQKWYKQLPPEAHYKHATVEDTNNANKPIIVNRAMLHLVHFCALSALHRPQVLPSAPSHTTGADLLEVSRRKVRWAANEITDIAQNLCTLDLVKYLPTTGVTVLLPAIIIHLLDIKAPDEETRRSSLRGFCQCMQVMSKLRDNYAAADYSCAFLEAAIRKAEIIVPQRLNNTQSSVPKKATLLSGQGLTNKLSNFKVDNLVAAGHDMHLVNSPIPPITHTLTPPPDPNASFDANQAATQPVHMSDADVAARLNSFLASTPPDSNSPDHIPDSSSFQSFETDTLNSGSNIDPVLTNPELAAFSSTKFADTALFPPTDFEQDFDSLLNTDLMLRDGQAGGGWGFGEDGGAALAMQGESSGFTFDMDFVKGMGGEMGEGQGNMAAQKNGKDTVDGVFEENSEGAQGEGGENVASEDNAKDQAVEQSSEPVPADNAVARRTLDVDGTGDNVATSAPLAVEAAA